MPHVEGSVPDGERQEITHDAPGGRLSSGLEVARNYTFSSKAPSEHGSPLDDRVHESGRTRTAIGGLKGRGIRASRLTTDHPKQSQNSTTPARVPPKPVGTTDLTA